MRDFNVAGRDIKTTNLESSKKDRHWIWNLLKLLSPLIIAAAVYLVYKLSGIKLSDFGL